MPAEQVPSPIARIHPRAVPDLSSGVPLDARVLSQSPITFKICVQSGKPLPSTLSGWYRGVFAAAAPLAPITACQVAVNGAIERAVTGGTRDPSDPERVGVAMAAGGVSLRPLLPRRSRRHSAAEDGPELTLDTVRAIASERGVAGLMRGFSSCVVREAIYTAGYLGLAPIAKDYLEKSHEHFAKNSSTPASWDRASAAPSRRC